MCIHAAKTNKKKIERNFSVRGLTFPRERQHGPRAALAALRGLGGTAVGTRRPGGPGPDHAVCRAGHLAGRLWRGRLALAVVGGDVLPCRRQGPACLTLDVQTSQPGPDRIESRGGQTQQSWETYKAKEEKRHSSIWVHQIKTWTLVKNNNGDNSFVDTVMGGRRPGVCLNTVFTARTKKRGWLGSLTCSARLCCHLQFPSKSPAFL